MRCKYILVDIVEDHHIHTFSFETRPWKQYPTSRQDVPCLGQTKIGRTGEPQVSQNHARGIREDTRPDMVPGLGQSSLDEDVSDEETSLQEVSKCHIRIMRSRPTNIASDRWEVGRARVSVHHGTLGDSRLAELNGVKGTSGKLT